MNAINKNIFANFLGTTWVSLMSFIFLPFYIHYLGAESYGLIGIFGMLQAWLGLFDLGLTPTLSREMARYSGGAVDAQYIRKLLKSITFLAFCIATLMSICIWLGSTQLATNWLKVDKLPLGTVSKAFTLMGIITALRFIEGLYKSAIVGLQKQIILNISMSIVESLRGFGALFVLACISPTIDSFFIWQIIVTLSSLAFYTFFVNASIPKTRSSISISFFELLNIKEYAGGMALTAFLALILTQIDKILLVRLLKLEEFGYYSLAFLIANTIYRLSGPVTQAVFPNLVELISKGDQNKLSNSYHRSCQLITVLMAPIVIVLTVHSETILILWTNDLKLSKFVAPILILLSTGVFLNGILQIPHLLQLAHNWTSLCNKINIIAIIFIVPAMLYFVPLYGAIGAAWVWATLNVICLFMMIETMHRRILKSEKWQWYIQDISLPFISALFPVILLHFFWSQDWNMFLKWLFVIFSISAAYIMAIVAAPIIRKDFLEFFKRKIFRRTLN